MMRLLEWLGSLRFIRRRVVLASPYSTFWHHEIKGDQKVFVWNSNWKITSTEYWFYRVGSKPITGEQHRVWEGR